MGTSGFTVATMSNSRSKNKQAIRQYRSDKRVIRSILDEWDPILVYFFNDPTPEDLPDYYEYQEEGYDYLVQSILRLLHDRLSHEDLCDRMSTTLEPYLGLNDIGARKIDSLVQGVLGWWSQRQLVTRGPSRRQFSTPRDPYATCPTCEGNGEILGRWNIFFGGTATTCPRCFGAKRIRRDDPYFRRRRYDREKQPDRRPINWDRELVGLWRDLPDVNPEIGGGNDIPLNSESDDAFLVRFVIVLFAALVVSIVLTVVLRLTM